MRSDCLDYHGQYHHKARSTRGLSRSIFVKKEGGICADCFMGLYVLVRCIFRVHKQLTGPD